MNVVAFVFSFVIFLGGLALMGYASAVSGFELIMFLGGIIAVAIAVAIPVHVLKRVDR
ncbi:hypothetical protein [Homoserinimonas hongtaonis]|uniref:hypothetical protein n=1 Tax=Homoserinimonas hongtaonis TaxID=2079791 RepID=UPI0018EE8C2B|nr:hypothetical protein [Salinibacterium hongtaonis]